MSQLNNRRWWSAAQYAKADGLGNSKKIIRQCGYDEWRINSSIIQTIRHSPIRRFAYLRFDRVAQYVLADLNLGTALESGGKR